VYRWLKEQRRERGEGDSGGGGVGVTLSHLQESGHSAVSAARAHQILLIWSHRHLQSRFVTGPTSCTFT